MDSVARGLASRVNNTGRLKGSYKGYLSTAEGVDTTASGNNSHSEGYCTIASGEGSHAEGDQTTASGTCSHSEGRDITASGHFSHAEGNETIASGTCSHAEGLSTISNGYDSHTEGYGSSASGSSSHAEGEHTLAYGDDSHAEGLNTTASSNYSHAEGQYTLSANGVMYNITAYNNTNKTITLNNVTGLSVGDKLQIKIVLDMSLSNISITKITGLVVTLNTTLVISSNWLYAVKLSSTMGAVHSEGYSSLACGLYSHAEGGTTLSTGEGSHAEGETTIASGRCSHTEGGATKASNTCSHAEGSSTTSSGLYSHSEGQNTVASGSCSHAENGGATASGLCSHAEGSLTKANGDYSHAEGGATTSDAFFSHTQGTYNKVLTGTPTAYSATADAFVIGNGTSASALSNAFRVTFNGKTYGLSAFNTTGADYAELFEWEDGNPDNEDRVGYFVTLNGEKIKKATSLSDYIIGVISTNPSIIGDNYADDWNGKYVTDKWGRIQYQNVLVPATDTQPERLDYVPVLNSSWDSSQPYTSREDRKEWGIVGMMGKLLVIDDGTCEVNGYCKPVNGIATKSDSGYRVIKRIDDTCVKIIII